ncbi:hypothetical protein BX600DRAFT_515782 [Xylariales sp. PMI_506]|nr:hypothetical protein BX600DRAFT_515782 [Xylariales sp. PMI_506]
MTWGKRLVGRCLQQLQQQRQQPSSICAAMQARAQGVRPTHIISRSSGYKSFHNGKSGSSSRGSSSSSSQPGRGAAPLGGTLLASAVVVALACKPIDTTTPPEVREQADAVWKQALETGSLSLAREAAWMSTLAWLAHYFHGAFADEGPMDQDILVYRGVYIPAADTRIYWLEPGSSLETPTVCVSLNFAWRASLEDCAELSEEEAADDDKWYAHMIERHVLYSMQARLDRWQAERGHDRFFVIFRYPDVTAYFAYDQEGWEALYPSDVLTQEDVTIHQ